jgi:hypothetical protein
MTSRSEAAALLVEIRFLLADAPVEVQAKVAEMLAFWLAGHETPGALDALKAMLARPIARRETGVLPDTLR